MEHPAASFVPANLEPAMIAACHQQQTGLGHFGDDPGESRLVEKNLRDALTYLATPSLHA
jgi:hypothetical protein